MEEPPCLPASGSARLEGGDNFLSISQRHSSPSALEDPTGALTVPGTCPLGRFCEKEGQRGRFSPLAASFLVYSPPPQLLARGLCQLFRCGQEGWSQSGVSQTATWEGRTETEGGGLRVPGLGIPYGQLWDRQGIRLL